MRRDRDRTTTGIFNVRTWASRQAGLDARGGVDRFEKIQQSGGRWKNEELTGRPGLPETQSG
jgi:hypothetical protein